MNRYLILFITIALLSCNGFGPRDTSHDTPIKNITELVNLPGIWYATENTYEILKEKNYKIDSVRIVLNPDSTFEFINIPDCIDDPFGEPKDHRLLTVKETWKPEEYIGNWDLSMTFEKGELFEKGANLGFDIFYIDNVMVLMHFIGDPDQADIMMFKKRN